MHIRYYMANLGICQGIPQGNTTIVFGGQYTYELAKETAKALGTKWNSRLKMWYANRPEYYPKFLKWFFHPETELIACNNLHLAVGYKRCSVCGYKSEVVQFAVDEYITWNWDSSLEDLFPYDEEARESVCLYIDVIKKQGIEFLPIIDFLPVEIEKYVHATYNYKKRYDPQFYWDTLQEYFYYNHCSNCQSPLPDPWWGFLEADTFSNKTVASELKFYTFQLEHDLELFIGGGVSGSYKRFSECCDFFTVKL